MPQPNQAADIRRPVVVVGTRDLEATVLRRMLDSVADVLAFVPHVERGLEAIREANPALVILFLDHERDLILALARRLVTEGYPSIVVSRDRDPDNILLAMRSGARDFAYLDGEENDVRRAIEALMVATPAPAPKRRGRVTAVFGAKGGCGATTIATNLAGALLEHGSDTRRVALLDLDVQMGDVLVFLDLASRYSWADLLGNLHRLDDELVHRTLTAHSSGLRVVAQTTQLEDGDHIDAAAVKRTLEFLREHYDDVVIDGLRDFRENSLAALDAADRVIVAMTQDIPALKNASRCLEIFGRLGYPADKLKLVLNRYHKREKLDIDTIGDALGAAVDATVQNDFQTVVKSVNEGVLLVKAAPRARVTRDVRELLPALGLAEASARRGGLFGRKKR